MSTAAIANGSPSILRSVIAVFVGLIFIVITHNAVDLVMHVTSVFPPVGQPMSDAMYAIPLSYRILLSISGCYLTALVATNRPMFHALILGFIGMVLSTIGVVATWNAGPAYDVKWYAIALAVTSVPCAWVGGFLRERQLLAS
ncbi:MAG: hypothetical protein ABIZ95_16185 [Pyrinomonadaceae bacterium]